MESLTVKADLVNLDMVLDFAKRILEKQNAPAEVITQMQFCMDEMFANIAKYAYPDKNGIVIVSADTGQQGEIVFVLEDEGIPYNPLEHKQPDITKPLEERQIGGLGIFLVRNTVDQMHYCYENGKNKLSLVKRWNTDRRRAENGLS